MVVIRDASSRTARQKSAKNESEEAKTVIEAGGCGN
jgi:hypothetical protein